MTNTSSNIVREESFDIENPDVTVATISSDVKIIESVDGRCHVVVSGKSMSQTNLDEFIEIISSGPNLSIRVDKGGRGLRGLLTGGSGHFLVVVSLPTNSELKVTTVSADVEVFPALKTLNIGTISGDISVLRNPTGSCVLKTVSGDITARTYSACQYSLNSVSGHIKVHVAPGLEVDVDGKSISGDLESEISLSASDDAPSQNDDIVMISTSTISGDFTLARN